MMLLLDIGNSRVKWGWWNGRNLRNCGAAVHAGVPAESAFGFLADMAPPDRVLVANVAGDAMEKAVRTAIDGRWNMQSELMHATPRAAGVTNGYRDPAQLGIDRWLAMLAAWSRQRRALCVVDAGTAVTIDLIDDAGQHLGGFIAPGIELMIAALGRGTGDIARRASAGRSRDEMPARDTGAAVRAGALLALAGLVDKACQRGAKTDCALFLTGGDAGQLLPVLERSAELCPDLVLEGLPLAALDPQG